MRCPSEPTLIRRRIACLAPATFEGVRIKGSFRRTAASAVGAAAIIDSMIPLGVMSRLSYKLNVAHFLPPMLHADVIALVAQGGTTER